MKAKKSGVQHPCPVCGLECEFDEGTAQWRHIDPTAECFLYSARDRAEDRDDKEESL